jgi:hypothetical protein
MFVEYARLQEPGEPEATFCFWTEATKYQVQGDMEDFFEKMKELQTGEESVTVCDKMKQKVNTKIDHKMEQMWMKLLWDYNMYGHIWANDGAD